MMDWVKECNKWHSMAIDCLQKFGKTPFMLRLYPFPTDNCVVWLEPDGLSDEGRRKLRILNLGFKATTPAAILLQSDTWRADNTRFSKYFGLSETLSCEQFRKEYLRILNEKFQGSLSNVPDEAKGETVFTILKGPRLQMITKFTEYHRENGKVILDAETPPGYFESNLVPDWWETTVQ